MKKLSIAALAVSSVLTAQSAMASETQTTKEKCYGVAKAGQNDCGNSLHGCGNNSKTKEDYLKTEWKYVPKGECTTMQAALAKKAAPKMKAVSKKKETIKKGK